MNFSRYSRAFFLALTVGVPAAALSAQQASFVYRLGKDTAIVEQYTRSANRLMGEVASRTGPVVVRTQYDATLGADGRVTAVTYKVFGADGKPIKGRPLEVRYTVKGDSAQRVVVWADSTQNRTLGAVGAVPFSSPAYGMMEVAIMALRRGSMPAGGFSLMGANAAPTLPTVALTTAGGDTIRLPGGVVFHVDRENRMQSFDASSSTQKLMATRGPGGLDIASIAGRRPPWERFRPRHGASVAPGAGAWRRHHDRLRPATGARTHGMGRAAHSTRHHLASRRE